MEIETNENNDLKIDLQPIIESAISTPHIEKKNEETNVEQNNNSTDDDEIINAGNMRRCCTNITCNGHILSCVSRDCSDNCFTILFKTITFIFILCLVYLLTQSAEDVVDKIIKVFKK